MEYALTNREAVALVLGLAFLLVTNVVLGRRWY